ncbi:MAG: hypothetical protein P8013_13930 [Candidatus Sulfobium sp.]
MSGEEGRELSNLARELGIEVAGLIPQDRNIFEYDLQGKAIVDLPADSPAVAALYGILDTLKIA